MNSQIVLSTETTNGTVEKEVKMPRGRRQKGVKEPKKLERLERLKNRILSLNNELKKEGYGSLLQTPGPIQPIGVPIHDPKTNGYIAHAEEPLGTYIQRVSVSENYSQRPAFDHVMDKIYRRLIRDFIQGAVMPESKVAALSQTPNNKKAVSLNELDITYSIIDGLQRLYCYCIAVLLILRKDQLVADGCIPQGAWDYFKESLEVAGNSRPSVEELLKGKIRYEVFYQIDLEGLLHYMVTFNTGQRSMSLPVQLEIMQRPLIRELRDVAKIPIYQEMESMPGAKRPMEKFTAKDLILASEAFIRGDAQVTQSEEAERLLEENRSFLNLEIDVGDIADVITALKRICLQIHDTIMEVYKDDPSKRFILSGGGVFFVSLTAACGYTRNRTNMKVLDGYLDKLSQELAKPVEDPLKLEEYQEALKTITASRGKATRRLVYDTFLRFFTGATMELEWMDTAASVSV